MQREARARAKVRREILNSKNDNSGDNQAGHDYSRQIDREHRARSAAIPASAGDDTEAEADAKDEEGDLDPDPDLLSLSPDALRIYGLPHIDEDELFEEQEGFHTSSEPSFTDFFESSDSDTAAGDGPRDDDDEFTTDSEDLDISDLEGGILDAPLIAHIGTTTGSAPPQGAEESLAVANGEIRPEVPLLVIEDLDGRLIYARAGDGEAVFGSDGEFEFVDDSEDDSTDYEYDARGNRTWGNFGSMGLLGPPEDDGDTTDELPDQDMPYPRLLVGSVAPRGGRNSRRARAMAAKSRMLSPSRGTASGLPPPTSTRPPELNLRSGSHVSATEGEGSNSSGTNGSLTSPQDRPVELDLTISTDDLARDPEGTLKAAAQALGVTVEEAAALISGVEVPSAIANGSAAKQITDGSLNGLTSSSAATNIPPPRTPDVQRNANFIKPEMGHFMPTSSKGVHRAVIDGSRKAPSPFSGKRSLQKKGLAKKRTAGRRSSLNLQNTKRLRRFSSAADQGSAVEALSELAASSPEPEQIDPMDLDDVVDADMLWRGTSSKSPSPDAVADDEAGKSSRKVPRRSLSNAMSPSLNLNAFARWDKVPMGTFRDSQGSAPFNLQHQRPLGTFLLTRSQGTSHRRQDHSPFRTTSDAVRNPEMFSMSPIRPHHSSMAIDAATGESSGAGRRRSFIISPVLFPTRHGGFASADNANLLPLERMTSFPLGQDFSVQASNNSAGPGRITRREKRERRARRVALLASQGDNDDGASVSSARSEPSRSPNPTTPQLFKVSLQGPLADGSDSPASALPKMRVTDASPTPRASPGPTSNVVDGPKLRTESLLGIGQESSTDGSLSVPDAAEYHTSGQEFSTQQEAGPEKHVGNSGGLPSSACKTPLHSPLFGGIFGSMNDDLDDKDGENALTI